MPDSKDHRSIVLETTTRDFLGMVDDFARYGRLPHLDGRLACKLAVDILERADTERPEIKAFLIAVLKFEKHK